MSRQLSEEEMDQQNWDRLVNTIDKQRIQIKSLKTQIKNLKYKLKDKENKIIEIIDGEGV